MAQIDERIAFLRKAAADGLDAALVQHGHQLSVAEAEGLRELSAEQLSALADVTQTLRTGLSEDGVAAWTCNGSC